MNKIAAIYVIVNKVNCKIYLGSTKNFLTNRNRHLSVLRGEKHWNEHLQRAWNKYREENFKIFPVEEFRNISENLLRAKEKWYISEFNLCDRSVGYNISPDPKNREVSGETKEKLSKSLREWHKNNNHPRGMLGKQHSDEVKNKIRLVTAGEKNPFYGKHHTKASIARMKASRANQVMKRDSRGRFTA